MTEILITNAYSARNRGDAAIILGMLESLRRTEIFREAEIRISSADYPADSADYPVPVVPSFHSLKNRFSSRSNLNALYFLVVLLPMSLLWGIAWRFVRVDLPLPGPLRELMRAYARADLVVAAGGGYLYTTSAIHGNVVLLITVYSFFFGVLLGKPVSLYAQSIGPFAAPWQEWFVRQALSRVRLVEVREKVSRRLLNGWRLSTPVWDAADAAFLLQARPPDEDLEMVGTTSGPAVGMTVRKWFRNHECQDGYERIMASFVDWLAEERGAEVVFLPQVTFAEGGDDDRAAVRSVVSSVARHDQVRIVEGELSAEEIKWYCGRMEFFVGTRMHSNIFALSLGVPTLAVAYQPKTEGIMAALGMEDFVIPIEDLSLDALTDRFETLTRDEEEVREHLRRVIGKVEEDAKLAGRLIAEDFLNLALEAGRGGGEPHPLAGR